MTNNGVGINLVNCHKCNIYDNSIDMNKKMSCGVYMESISAGVKIKNNLFFNFANYNNAYTNYGIYTSNDIDNCEIEKNVFRLSGTGINGLNILSIGKNLEIKNNVFILEEPESDINCVTIVEDTYSENTYKILNNLFIYNGNLSATYNSYVFDISSTNIGDINYNLIHNFNSDEYYKLEISGVSDLNSKLITINPKILSLENSATYYTSAYDSYFVSADSKSLGFGTYYENIGLGNFNNEVYLSFVDTVTHNCGNIQYNSYNTELNLLSNVFTESVDEVNNYYDKGYTTEDLYYNQFLWNYVEESFPFLSGNDLYNKNLNYVIRYKNLLEPFDNISCPANPGYGSSAYSGYETGLFGWNRNEYVNNCQPCIIQDDYIVDDIIQDTIDSEDIIQDMINPPCIYL